MGLNIKSEKLITPDSPQFVSELESESLELIRAYVKNEIFKCVQMHIHTGALTSTKKKKIKHRQKWYTFITFSRQERGMFMYASTENNVV